MKSYEVKVFNKYYILSYYALSTTRCEQYRDLDEDHTLIALVFF